MWDLFLEIRDLLGLALPMATSQMAYIGMKTTGTALIGHTSSRFLTAASLSDMWMHSSLVLTSGMVMSTFASQAIGSNNKKLAGVWAHVALLVLSIASIPVMIIWCCIGPMLSAVGAEASLIGPAEYYCFVLLSAIPARIMSHVVNQYFLAQRITRPLVVCGITALVLNLALGLLLVLGIPIPGWPGLGFALCPVVTALVEWTQLSIMIFFYCKYRQLHTDCWPGWSWSHITKARVMKFSTVFFPAALGGVSTWLYVLTMGLVIFYLDDTVSLGVHNSAYKLQLLSMTFTGSIGQALGVKMGNALGAGDIRATRRIGLVGLTAAVSVLSVISFILCAFPEYIACIFSDDPAIIRLYKTVAAPLAFQIFASNLCVILEKIPLACGRTDIVFYNNVIGSWVVVLPTVALLTHYWRNDLYAVYCGIGFGYSLMTVVLLYIITTTNFEVYAIQARLRSEVKEVKEVKAESELVETKDDRQPLLQDDRGESGSRKQQYSTMP